jgi:hypothetical protein
MAIARRINLSYDTGRKQHQYPALGRLLFFFKLTWQEGNPFVPLPLPSL